jgi:hypothetical protein
MKKIVDQIKKLYTLIEVEKKQALFCLQIIMLLANVSLN